jgi:uncharacterized protein YndB with AHSA1/START domain
MSASGDIVREVRIDAPPDAVFPFFTEPDKMIVWKAVEATLDPRPGGIFRINVTGHDIARGEYVEIDPPRRVVFTFGWETESSPEPPGSTTVEDHIGSRRPGDSASTGAQRNSDEIRAGSDEGWGHYLQRLVIAAQGGEPGPDPWATQQTNANDERSA